MHRSLWLDLEATSLVAQMVKVSAYNVGVPGLIPGSGRSPEEGNGNPLQYFCLENPHGQRSLVGSSPWGHKESDMTEYACTQAQEDKEEGGEEGQGKGEG